MKLLNYRDQGVVWSVGMVASDNGAKRTCVGYNSKTRGKIYNPIQGPKPQTAPKSKLYKPNEK